MAISLRLVQDFLLRLFDVLTDFSVSAEAELLSGSACLLDPGLFLFLLFPLNRVLPFLTGGVAGLSVIISTAVVDEAISSGLPTSTSFCRTVSGLAAF